MSAVGDAVFLHFHDCVSEETKLSCGASSHRPSSLFSWWGNKRGSLENFSQKYCSRYCAVIAMLLIHVHQNLCSKPGVLVQVGINTNGHPLTDQIKLIDFPSVCLTQCMFHMVLYTGNRRLISVEQATKLACNLSKFHKPGQVHFKGYYGGEKSDINRGLPCCIELNVLLLTMNCCISCSHV